MRSIGTTLVAWVSMRTILSGSAELRALLTTNNSKEFGTIVQNCSTRFDDVEGVDEVKQELLEVVSFLRNPEFFSRLGAQMPHGVLLSGPPGTGKTLLARAVAGEAGVPFICASASSFDEKYVGVGASRVRSIFAVARRVAPAIIFIDEIDSIGFSRYDDSRAVHAQTLNALLVEMDGFASNQGLVVIAATNQVCALPPSPGLPRPVLTSSRRIASSGVLSLQLSSARSSAVYPCIQHTHNQS